MLRSQVNAATCKTRDIYTCRVCMSTGDLDLSFMYEQHMSIASKLLKFKVIKTKLLARLQLVTISYVENLITLCTDCNSLFHHHLIGIDRDLKSWIFHPILLRQRP
jgi:hypothetical protein